MTIFGLDFSHYDAVPDGARVVSEGFSFMTHKAGGDGDDAELGAWWKALKPHRDQVLLGAYWVLYPGSPAGRADAFLARLDSQCPGWRDGPFLLQLDCEKWNGSSATVPGKADIKACCDRLAARMPKLRPVVYAPKWVYGDSLSGLGYPLWASSYVTGSGSASKLYPGDSSPKWGAYSGQTPAILQFTSSATAVGQTTCDANAYRGTLAELTALLAPGWSEDMDLTPANLEAIADAVWNHTETDPLSTTTPPGDGRMGGWIRMQESRSLGRFNALMAAVTGAGSVDEQAIVTGVLAGLSPAAIAAAIPADIAQQVADVLAQRLSA